MNETWEHGKKPNFWLLFGDFIIQFRGNRMIQTQ